MPYVAVKPRKIAGRTYARGEVVDTSALPMPKLASLVRIGLLIQQDQAVMAGIGSQERAVVVEDQAIDDDRLCPICGQGPYQNVRLHITKSHEDEPPGESVEDLDEQE